jgi:hypothetical protein
MLRRRFRPFLVVALLTGICSVFGALSSPASAAEPEELEATARREFQAAVKGNPKLRGAWIELHKTEAGAFQVAAIVDARTEIGERQRAEIQKLVRARLPDYQGELLVTSLPFSDFLKGLQGALDDRVELSGCLVQDAYYCDVGGELLVVLVGRIADAAQRQELVNLGNEVLLPQTYGKKSVKFPSRTVQVTKCLPEGPEQNDPGLAVVAPSEAKAKQHFARGVGEYGKGRFPQAVEAFREANLEAPERLDYQYWRVVAELGAGHADRARRRLTPLVKRLQAEPLERAEVLRALERVQGPLRRKLEQLEQQIRDENP